MRQTFYLLFIVGLIFGSLGAIMAYLITYKEWMHHYPTKKEPRKMALETAIFTFIFFMLVALLVGVVIK